jgi:hypothetical protein
MAKSENRHNPAKERFWRQAIRRQRRSGLSIRAYCEENGLKEPSFYWWRRELAWRDGQGEKATRRRGGQRPRAARQSKPGRAAVEEKARGKRPAGNDRLADADGTPRFVPIWLAADVAAAGGLEIVTRHGSRIRLARGFDRQTLVEVLSVLEGESC